ncbi:MAG: hypothetical protein IJ668_00935 [Selenomonadaceae bacterium]|nr:hypothetical protein [Selenomonadaceae bacterium]
MADDSKKKKKSIIASLDLKNYKAKYTDPYGNGEAKEVGLDDFIKEEEPKPLSPPPPSPPPPPTPPTPPSPVEPKVEPKIELKVEPIVEPKIGPKVEPKIEPKVEPPKSKKRKGEKQNKKLHLREPIKVNVRREVKDRPIGGIDPNADPIDDEPKPYHRRVESYGIAISAVALVYSLYTADKASFFLSLSLLTYLIRPTVGALFGKHNQTVQNALKGFSIAVFFGAILFLFC